MGKNVGWTKALPCLPSASVRVSQSPKPSTPNCSLVFGIEGLERGETLKPESLAAVFLGPPAEAAFESQSLSSDDTRRLRDSLRALDLRFIDWHFILSSKTTA